ncbi:MULTISPECIES: methionine ABC transporter ATP-binding protein [unclassified Exiguobacterium]|uniref:methionine ABC transporter ATP-binding protein n=1 Tax=unclassified Exiguobacterium TaxID=2644629 RepID=UPI001BEA3BEF|nr:MULTISPECIES: methionine ABC transporter ATP-binding protein [unclassified Exiguobacterium]
MIQLRNVAKWFDTKNGRVQAVDDVSLTIDHGEIFGIIGYSGAGKSTLIRLLNRLESPSSGEIEVAGSELTKLSPKELRGVRKNVSMVFQHFNLLWSRTVAENISFPLELIGVPANERKRRVQELVELVGLAGREDSYPSQLSGGQKQRVGIARALATNPEVLLCDEATSALDPKTTDSILELLVSINKKLGLTIVLITHEMHVIQKICHRVAVMEAGKVVETGQVSDVFQHPKQPITKEFVKQIGAVDDLSLTFEHLKERYPSGQVVKLKFLNETAEHPILSDVLKTHDIGFNIIGGNVTQSQVGALGTLFIQLIGEASEIERAIASIRSQSVEVEVESDVS